jgi:putative SOS response-associated peptidase YedK
MQDMCGRFAIIQTPEVLKEAFGYDDTPNFPPRYNIAPTQPVPVVHMQEGLRRFTLMRWGFIPGWVKDIKQYPLVINIRSETAREKASFRSAFIRRRALLPADGFYEWQRIDKTSRPFLLRRPDRGMFAFAALWETWSSSDGSEIDTVALLNTTANGVISAIHHRSPVILQPDCYDAWLDPHTQPDNAYRMLQPPPDDFFEMIPLGVAINKVANDGPYVQEKQPSYNPAQLMDDRITPKTSKPAKLEIKESTQGSLF